jgi:hypothetical protein
MRKNSAGVSSQKLKRAKKNQRRIAQKKKKYAEKGPFS